MIHLLRDQAMMLLQEIVNLAEPSFFGPLNFDLSAIDVMPESTSVEVFLFKRDVLEPCRDRLLMFTPEALIMARNQGEQDFSESIDNLVLSGRGILDRIRTLGRAKVRLSQLSTLALRCKVAQATSLHGHVSSEIASVTHEVNIASSTLHAFLTSVQEKYNDFCAAHNHIGHLYEGENTEEVEIKAIFEQIRDRLNTWKLLYGWESWPNGN